MELSSVSRSFSDIVFLHKCTFIWLRLGEGGSEESGRYSYQLADVIMWEGGSEESGQYSHQLAYIMLWEGARQTVMCFFLQHSRFRVQWLWIASNCHILGNGLQFAEPHESTHFFNWLRWPSTVALVMMIFEKYKARNLNHFSCNIRNNAPLAYTLSTTERDTK